MRRRPSLLYCAATAADTSLSSCSESRWALRVFLLSGHTAAGSGAGGSPGRARDTQSRGHCCFCVYSGPRMDDVTSSGGGKRSHESSTNRPRLRADKSDVSTAHFADLVQRRQCCRLWGGGGVEGGWDTGTNAGDTQGEGGAFNYLWISRRGGKLRKKFQICRECLKAHNFDHCEILAVTFMCHRVCQANLRIKRSTSPGAPTINYRGAHRPATRDLQVVPR